MVGYMRPSRRAAVLAQGLVVLAWLSLSYAQTVPDTRLTAVITELLSTAEGRAMLEAYQAILRDYAPGADRVAVLEGAIRGMVEALDDPYVSYLDPAETLVAAVKARDPNVVVAAMMGDLGYLRLLTFDSVRSGERLSTELDALLLRGARGLVLDLRGNDGGFVLTGLQVLDRFLADVVLGFREGPTGRTPLGFANPRSVTMPLAVLVDSDTASTAEIVAGALQTYGRARLYGQVTAGKGVGQSAVTLADGGELRLVTFGWLLPDGRSIDGWGLTPDVAVAKRAAPEVLSDPAGVLLDPELDPVLAAALRGLRRELGDMVTSTGGATNAGAADPDVPPAP